VVPCFEIYQSKSHIPIKLPHSVRTSFCQIGELTPLKLEKNEGVILSNAPAFRKNIALFYMKVSRLRLLVLLIRVAWRLVWVWSICCNGITLLLGNKCAPVPLGAPQIPHGPGQDRTRVSVGENRVVQHIMFTSSFLIAQKTRLVVLLKTSRLLLLSEISALDSGNRVKPVTTLLGPNSKFLNRNIRGTYGNLVLYSKCLNPAMVPELWRHGK
jgi:hypothetical protein